MRTLMSNEARPKLQPYVYAYAQRIWGNADSASVEFVPDQLEQILNFGPGPGQEFVIESVELRSGPDLSGSSAAVTLLSTVWQEDGMIYYFPLVAAGLAIREQRNFSAIQVRPFAEVNVRSVVLEADAHGSQQK